MREWGTRGKADGKRVTRCVCQQGKGTGRLEEAVASTGDTYMHTRGALHRISMGERER